MSLDLLRARVAFRQRSIPDVLDLALRFVVVHWRSYGKLALAWLLPLIAITLAYGQSPGWTKAWALALPLAFLADIPFTLLASRLVFEDDVGTSNIVRQALRETPRLVVMRLLSFVAIAFGAILLIAPAVWLMTLFLFLSEIMLLERASLGAALGRGQRIASGASAEVLIGAIALGVVPIAGIFLVDIAGRAVIGELLQFRPPEPVWSEGGSYLATLGLFLQAPYLATARFFLYLDVRTRAEGWDIQTRFAALSARPEEP